jgi:proteasome activator subunit 4
MLFRLWETINSYMYDDRMLHFLSNLAELHVDPTASDPENIQKIPDDDISEGEGRPQFSRDDLKQPTTWTGLYKDVGLFTEHEWNLLMCKCLASMGMVHHFDEDWVIDGINILEIPLADGGSLTTGPNADNRAGFEIGRLPKPEWRIR